MTSDSGNSNDTNSFYAQIVAVVEQQNGIRAAQQRRDSEDMINAAVNKAVQREVATAFKEILGPSGQAGGIVGNQQSMNDQTVADILMNGTMTSSLLRGVFGLVPNLLKR